MKRTLSILGATGSIGTSTLDLVANHPERFEVVALTAAQKVGELAEAARWTGARLAVIDDEALLPELKERLAGTRCQAAAGRAGLMEAAVSADLLMAAIVGCAGLEPVMAAVETGRVVALANKEALVTAGALMTDAARRSGATILPVDSEHNAIFQCLAGSRSEDVSRLILTASGGPFRERSLAEMSDMSPAQAVAHPNWSMGAKISVDSATMMNKGLELIEAHYLFGIASDRIDILVHPQSVIHSLVEFVDGSHLAQLGSPDMRIPIAHALAWPERMPTRAERLDLVRVGQLSFERPDPVRFPALRLARSALEASGSAPAALNGANEIAVEAFLRGAIKFCDIASLVEEVLDRNDAPAPRSTADVIDIDTKARETARQLMTSRAA